MATFPTKENDILALAAAIVAGAAANPGIFGASPVPWSDISNSLGLVNLRNVNITAIKASLVAEYALKEDQLEDLLVPQMKQFLAWAEVITNNDNAKLALVDWSAPKQPSPTAPPGQPRHFEAQVQDITSIEFDWKAPAKGDGGVLKSYCVERRLLPNGPWEVCDTTTKREKTVENQPRGVELEYRVCGMNSAGTGAPSNSVTLVL